MPTYMIGLDRKESYAICDYLLVSFQEMIYIPIYMYHLHTSLSSLIYVSTNSQMYFATVED